MKRSPPKRRKKLDDFAALTKKLQQAATKYAAAESFDDAAGYREKQRLLMIEALETLTASMLEMAKVLRAMPGSARDAIFDYSRGLIGEQELRNRWQQSWFVASEEGGEPGGTGCP